VTTLSKKELARYRCNDCSINVVTAGEFYMLKGEIWEGQLGLGLHDNLCIGCLEKRLGRKVSLRDMGSLQSYPWTKPPSVRLEHRLFGPLLTKRPPYRLLKRYRKNVGGLSKQACKAIGEYGAREEREAMHSRRQSDSASIKQVNAATSARRRRGPVVR
jgi:hypothetical protein